MNPNLCRVVLRRRDALEVFDLALRFMGTRWRSFRWLLVLVLMPPLAVGTAVLWFSSGHWGVLVAALLLLPVLRAPFTLLAGRLMFADEVPVGEVLGGLRSSFPSLLGGFALSTLAAGAGAVTCFYAMPFVAAALLYVPEAVLLERVTAGRSVRRSARLSSGHLGIALAGLVGTAFLTVWGALVADAAGAAIVHFMFQVPPVFGSLGEGRVTPYLLAGVLLAQPVIAVYRLLLYVDVRTRIEGWDLQVALRAAGLGTRLDGEAA